MEFEKKTYIVDPNGWVDLREHANLTQVESSHPVIQEAFERKVGDLSEIDVKGIFKELKHDGSDVEIYREIHHLLSGYEYESKHQDIVDRGALTPSRETYLTSMVGLVAAARDYYEYGLRSGEIPVYAYEGDNQEEAEELEDQYDAECLAGELPDMIERILKMAIRSLLNPDYDIELQRNVSEFETSFSDEQREVFRASRQEKKDALLQNQLGMTLEELIADVNK